MKCIAIAIKVTNGVFAPSIDNKIKRKNNKKEDIRNIEN
jgi:hypothetical protein